MRKSFQLYFPNFATFSTRLFHTASINVILHQKYIWNVERLEKTFLPRCECCFPVSTFPKLATLVLETTVETRKTKLTVVLKSNFWYPKNTTPTPRILVSWCWQHQIAKYIFFVVLLFSCCNMLSKNMVSYNFDDHENTNDKLSIMHNNKQIMIRCWYEFFRC